MKKDEYFYVDKIDKVILQDEKSNWMVIESSCSCKGIEYSIYDNFFGLLDGGIIECDYVSLNELVNYINMGATATTVFKNFSIYDKEIEYIIDKIDLKNSLDYIMCNTYNIVKNNLYLSSIKRGNIIFIDKKRLFFSKKEAECILEQYEGNLFTENISLVDNSDFVNSLKNKVIQGDIKIDDLDLCYKKYDPITSIIRLSDKRLYITELLYTDIKNHIQIEVENNILILVNIKDYNKVNFTNIDDYINKTTYDLVFVGKGSLNKIVSLNHSQIDEIMLKKELQKSKLRLSERISFAKNKSDNKIKIHRKEIVK